jgi:hypothetical protein
MRRHVEPHLPQRRLRLVEPEGPVLLQAHLRKSDNTTDIQGLTSGLYYKNILTIVSEDRNCLCFRFINQFRTMFVTF